MRGLRRRLAVLNTNFDNYIDRVTVIEVLNLKVNELFIIEGGIGPAPAAPIDCDRYNNRRILSYNKDGIIRLII